LSGGPAASAVAINALVTATPPAAGTTPARPFSASLLPSSATPSRRWLRQSFASDNARASSASVSLFSVFIVGRLHAAVRMRAA